MKKNKVVLTLNLIIISAVFVLNFFYQKNGFDFTLKCICSAGFALTGIINLVYALLLKAKKPVFYILMTVALLFAFLGDVLIAFDFIVGAGTFALGHIVFVAAYCVLQKPKALDALWGGGLFALAASILLFAPFMSFEAEVLKIVCVAYALIISCMLGKALGNFVREKNAFNLMIASGSVLFFISDLMLALGKFGDVGTWASHACMATYYPALCLLAFSMFYKAQSEK